MSGDPAIERLLRRDRWVTLAALAVLVVLAWAWLVTGAGTGQSLWILSLFPHQAAAPVASGMQAMPGMDMGGMASPAAAPAFNPAAFGLMLGMWWVMMIAMMTPSTAPTVLLYARVHRQSLGQMSLGRAVAEGLAPTGWFVAGYLLIWFAFSLAAAILHEVLAGAELLSAMGSQSRWLSAGVLLAAGLYQLTPLKSFCLAHCRAPAQFLSRHYRPDALGALRLGVLHGAYCVGCCWVLMALLFVGGVMNLAWIAAITLLVLAEKLLPAGPWTARLTGALLLTWSLATLLV